MILRRARWRLTLWFATIQLGLYGAFALAVYAYATSAFDIDGAEDGPVAQTAEAGFATLRVALLLAFAALLVVIPLTSRALAVVAMRPVQASFEAQQRFVDDASHELRTPLSALRAQLELAASRPRSPEDYRAAIDRSLIATESLASTISDLLLLSRSEHEQGAAFERIEAQDLVERAVRHLPHPARIDVHSSVTAYVVGSRGMLERALVNLLTNAARYSPENSRILVAINRRSTMLAIEITDRGIGMTPAELQRATERFWRADASRSTDGNGLGLSIVSEIARMHHGSLQLRSQPDAGTTATLVIPLSR